MKKRILAIALCVCMAFTGMMPAFADGDVSGDANGDAAVTPADAALLLRWCVGLDYRLDMRGRMLADVDCSGYANEGDAAQILRGSHMSRRDKKNRHSEECRPKCQKIQRLSA